MLFTLPRHHFFSAQISALLLGLCIFLISCDSGNETNPPQGDAPPLTTLQRSGNILTYDGEPWKRIAMNKVDLFWQFLGSASGTTPSVTRPQALKAMDEAVAAGVCCFRIAAIPYYPDEMASWQNAPATYWAAFDDMMAEANKRSLKLILTAWWNTLIFADMAGEPMQDTFIAGSNSRQFLFDYVTQLVSRYKDHEALLFWELTNELNLHADLDLSLLPNLGINPAAGTPTQRTSADNFTSDQMATLMGELASLVRSLDPDHLISSGYAVPRPSAWHLRAQPQWSAAGADWTFDSKAEMQQYLALTHPDPIDLISIHFYPGEERWGVSGAPSPAQLETYHAAATALGKPLFLGEFGDINPTVSEDRRANSTRQIMLQAVAQKIPLSLIWTWQFYQFSPTMPSPHSIEPGADDDLIATFTELNTLLTNAPATSMTEPTVANQGFEIDANANNQPDGWETTWRNGTGADHSVTKVNDANEAFLGQNYLRLDSGSEDPDSYVFVLSDPIAVNGGEQVILSAAGRHNLVAPQMAYLTLVEYDVSNTELDIRDIAIPVAGGGQFQIHYMAERLRIETRSVRIRLSAGGGASTILDVDDVRLIAVAP